ncbi:hypothetical protein Csa_001457 [Cucumis sativus]|uniref:Uncharacterized protein n=1 Tax=Cucumis sativus TaxID=3659 RepID=A0A0A0LCZ8_CUCSA|nr:hypothetical protein Csa_001457 [Cucumis sativus]
MIGLLFDKVCGKKDDGKIHEASKISTINRDRSPTHNITGTSLLIPVTLPSLLIFFSFSALLKSKRLSFTDLFPP